MYAVLELRGASGGLAPLVQALPQTPIISLRSALAIRPPWNCLIIRPLHVRRHSAVFSYSVDPRLPPIHTGRYSVIAIKVSISKYRSRYRYFYGKVSISVSTILLKPASISNIGDTFGNRMWPMEWHHYQCSWMILKVTFAVGNCSSSHPSWNVVRIY